MLIYLFQRCCYDPMNLGDPDKAKHFFFFNFGNSIVLKMNSDLEGKRDR